jgi:hypothetical protein
LTPCATGEHSCRVIPPVAAGRREPLGAVAGDVLLHESLRRTDGASIRERGSMVFKVELDGQVVSCSSPGCINWLLLHGWKLADPAQWDDLKHALQSESD